MSLRFVLKNVQKRKVRSWLTMIGIIIGVAAIMSLFLLSQGLKDAIDEQFSQLGVDSIRVVPGGLNGPPSGSLGFSKNLQKNIERVKSVDYVNPVVISFAETEFQREKQFAFVNGYDVDLSDKGFVDLDIDVSAGRFLIKGDTFNILIGDGVAHDVFESDVGLRNTLIIKNKKFKVVGILEKTGTEVDNRVYVPLDTMRDVFGKNDEVNVFVVKLKKGISIDVAASAIERELQKTLNKEEFEVFTPERLIAQIQGIFTAVQIVIVAIALISLLVGGIGIMNAMFTSVLERTKDIGVMKAIGATNKNILSFFLLEAGVIGTIGGVIGAVIGTILAFSVAEISQVLGFSLLKISFDPLLFLFAVFFSFGVGVVSGLIPAIRASRLQPVDALRYE
jgi:putative ABC transport system permease protein